MSASTFRITGAVSKPLAFWRENKQRGKRTTKQKFSDLPLFVLPFSRSHSLYETERKSKIGWVTNGLSSSHVGLSTSDNVNLTNCRKVYSIWKNNSYALCTPQVVEIRDRTRWVSRGSGNQCPRELFSQDVLTFDPKSDF